jgi:hypothetical protein
MVRALRQSREFVAGDCAYRNAGRLAEFDDLLDARVASSSGHSNIVKSASARGQGFFDGMDSKDGLHGELVPGNNPASQCFKKLKGAQVRAAPQWAASSVTPR